MMQTEEIRKWLEQRGLEQKKIARDLRVSPALVSMVISGERSKTSRNGKRVVKKLRREGCPEEFLSAEVNHA